MPVYNERTVVERCISLVLAASLPENMDRELIIVDDCSTDGAYAILERLAAAHPEIQLQPLLDGRADAVFGSRYLAGEQTRVLPFWHSLINKTLTMITNMFCNLN